MENMNFVFATLMYLIAIAIHTAARWELTKQVYAALWQAVGKKYVVTTSVITIALWMMSYWSYHNIEGFKAFYDYASTIYLALMIAYVLHIKVRKPQA